jgi:CDP-glucose 4,6-dehydratase
MTAVDNNFWRGKRVFLTGHTGFKGSWMALWLQAMGAHVKGFALEPNTTPSLFNEANVAQHMESVTGDIRDADAIARGMSVFNPDILIHMAAQPLVRQSYEAPVETYGTNVMGTVHVLEAARKCDRLRAIINVTTDKCYENREWEWPYREDEALGGHDPYSSSKGCAELVTAAYRRSFFHRPDDAALASARAGNVIGGGDWAQDRLLPDVLRAFGAGEAVTIRYPYAVRPWQHVLEPLSGYLLLAEQLFQQGQSMAVPWNFGPAADGAQPVQWIVEHMVKQWGNGASWAVEDSDQPHEAQILRLDTTRARSRLGWHPRWDLSTTLGRIVAWHQAWLGGADARRLCQNEIIHFNRQGA